MLRSMSGAPVPAGHAVARAGTRTRMPRTQRRAQLLAIGEELFASHGYHHISMDDIAARAGVGKPVLYRHFPSKLDLYLAVVDAQGDELVRTVHATLDPYRAPRGAAGETCSPARGSPWSRASCAPTSPTHAPRGAPPPCSSSPTCCATRRSARGSSSTTRGSRAPSPTSSRA
ncbi:hypothetical protein BJF88_16845 [Cellulosimicrobium sp. CUA-896]|nr:hypothetical protein BJF88_16845 [Cellulosimicrobium sp. CUA-896]